MRKKYKVCLIIIVGLLLISSGIGIFSLFKKTEVDKNKNITNIISNIADFGYTLDDRDTKYMEETFKELETILNESEIDYQKYAQVLAKLFVIDFYTLNNKLNKYDVGSIEYVLSDKLEEFKLKAGDTIYKDIIDNTYKNRVQKLPEITNIEIVEEETTKIKINEEEKDAYKISMKYSYKEELGYDQEGTVYLIKTNNKLEVALYNPKIEEKESK